MRHVRIVDGMYGAFEDLLYSIGDAEDFIERERPNFCDYVEKVAFGEMSAVEAKRRINEAFANASRQISEARELTAGNARRAGFSHIHESLASEPPAVIPVMRLIAHLPEGA